VHYNQSNDLKLFTGDGGDSEMVAHAPDGKYLYLFTPKPIPDDAEIPTADAEKLIVPGTFAQEKLVDMRKHNYKTEPNMTFTPDGKWIIFRGHFENDPDEHGTHVYAVEVAKAQ
jgi:oligogalacturonide lyase